MANTPKDASDRKPEQATQLPQQYGNPWQAVKMDLFAGNNLIAQNGILCMHYSAIPDVIHQKIEGDLRTSFDQDDNFQFEDTTVFKRENGFIYIPKKPVYVIFTNNSTDLKNTQSGLYGSSNAYGTVNKWYQNTEEEVFISEYDKLIPCEQAIPYTTFQKFQHNNAGIDRVQFPILDIEFLYDSDGKTYQKNVDFSITEGVIKWEGHNRPGLDNDTGKGKICGIRYRYKPYFYVKMVPHNFRSTPVIDALGKTKIERGPMQIVLQADQLFLNERKRAENDISQVLVDSDSDNTGYR